MHKHKALDKQTEIKFQIKSRELRDIKHGTFGEKMLSSTRLIFVGLFGFGGFTLSGIKVKKVSPVLE